LHARHRGVSRRRPIVSLVCGRSDRARQKGRALRRIEFVNVTLTIKERMIISRFQSIAPRLFSSVGAALVCASVIMYPGYALAINEAQCTGGQNACSLGCSANNAGNGCTGKCAQNMTNCVKCKCTFNNDPEDPQCFCK